MKSFLQGMVLLMFLCSVSPAQSVATTDKLATGPNSSASSLRVQVWLSEANPNHIIITLLDGRELPKLRTKKYKTMVEDLKGKLYVNAYPGKDGISLNKKR